MNKNWTPEPRCFKIVRFRMDRPKRTIRNNVTETEAQDHCSREDTHGKDWFDGYEYMPGCKPQEEG